MIDTPIWIQMLQGLLTPVIAIVATYIAWQQWKANETKLRLDRYDRRLAVYREVMVFVSAVVREAKCSTGELLAFRSKTFEADFLFANEIPEYIDEVFQHALKLLTANSQYRDYTQQPPPDYDHLKVVNEMDSQLKWFIDQPAAAKAKFKQYLIVT